MKKVVYLSASFFLLACFFAQAQSIFETRAAKASFFSSAPLENISAVTEKASSVIDIQKGEIAFLIPVNSFSFERSLMQEHFNENYMESSRYPKATFKGSFKEKINPSLSTPQNITVTGELEIHGVKQTRSIVAQIVFKDGKPLGTARFKVKLADHNIKIPKMVFKNIAEEVEVTIEAFYSTLKQ